MSWELKVNEKALIAENNILFNKTFNPLGCNYQRMIFSYRKGLTCGLCFRSAPFFRFPLSAAHETRAKRAFCLVDGYYASMHLLRVARTNVFIQSR